MSSSHQFDLSNIYGNLPCGKACICTEKYIAAEKSANVRYQKRWESTLKDSIEAGEGPITSLKGKSINIGRIDVSTLSGIHDTCSTLRINDDPDKKLYIIKTANRADKVHRLYKEIIILCTMPPHKSILSRPSLVTADYTEQNGNSTAMDHGTAVIGFMSKYYSSGTLRMNLKDAASLGKDIPGPTQVSWSLQLIDALIHLHRVAGIAHLALKQENILVDTSPECSEIGGRIILIDFEQSGSSRAFESHGLTVANRGGDTILESNSVTQACDIHALALIIWMIFESCGSYTQIFLNRPPDDAQCVHSHATHSMLHYFLKTPMCMRKILYECTREHNHHNGYPNFETLREVIADTTRHPWSPSFKPFDTSLTHKLWKMQVDADLPPTALTQLYDESSSAYRDYVHMLSTRRKAAPSEEESKENVEIGGVTDVAKQENSPEMEVNRAKDAKQEIAELRAQIEGWHEYKDICYCALPEEHKSSAPAYIEENNHKRRRLHGIYRHRSMHSALWR